MKIKFSVLMFFLWQLSSANAAISLDRTRTIFPGDLDTVMLHIKNENNLKPFLAQVWISDENGKKINSPLKALPPIQRLEPGLESVVRISGSPILKRLPQDRETLFFFNIREIPPRPDKPNVLQIALLSKIKLFYRPTSILHKKQNPVTLYETDTGYNIENKSPFYVTILGIGNSKLDIPEKFDATMISPFSSKKIKAKHYEKPFVTTINDFGGKPSVRYSCINHRCVIDENVE